MPKQKIEQLTGFGARLAELRRAADFTQAELAKAVGTTQRMMSYYEQQADPAPSNLLAKLAKVLGVTVDELLGVTPPKKKPRMPDTRLMRRMQQIDKLPPKEKRQVLQLLDTFIEREQLKKKTG